MSEQGSAGRQLAPGPWRNEESWSDGMLALFDVQHDDFEGDATPIMEKRLLAADLGPVLEARTTTAETGEPVPLEYHVLRRDRRRASSIAGAGRARQRAKWWR